MCILFDACPGVFIGPWKWCHFLHSLFYSMIIESLVRMDVLYCGRLGWKELFFYFWKWCHFQHSFSHHGHWVAGGCECTLLWKVGVERVVHLSLEMVSLSVLVFCCLFFTSWHWVTGEDGCTLLWKIEVERVVHLPLEMTSPSFLAFLRMGGLYFVVVDPVHCCFTGWEGCILLWMDGVWRVHSFVSGSDNTLSIPFYIVKTQMGKKGIQILMRQYNVCKFFKVTLTVKLW